MFLLSTHVFISIWWANSLSKLSNQLIHLILSFKHLKDFWNKKTDQSYWNFHHKSFTYVYFKLQQHYEFIASLKCIPKYDHTLKVSDLNQFRILVGTMNTREIRRSNQNSLISVAKISFQIFAPWIRFSNTLCLFIYRVKRTSIVQVFFEENILVSLLWSRICVSLYSKNLKDMRLDIQHANEQKKIWSICQWYSIPLQSSFL